MTRPIDSGYQTSENLAKYKRTNLPSRFIPASKHLRNLHARQWFLCVLSTGHCPNTEFCNWPYFRELLVRLPIKSSIEPIGSCTLTCTLRFTGVPAIPVNAPFEEAWTAYRRIGGWYKWVNYKNEGRVISLVQQTDSSSSFLWNHC